MHASHAHPPTSHALSQPGQGPWKPKTLIPAVHTHRFTPATLADQLYERSTSECRGVQLPAGPRYTKLRDGDVIPFKGI
eukprot:1083089-Pelagomonas_calceolata.AAC.4